MNAKSRNWKKTIANHLTHYENHRQVSGTLHKDLEEKNKLVRVLEEQSKAQQLVHTQEKDNHERQIIHTQEKDNHERQITELEENHRQVSGTLHKDLEEKNKLVRVLEEQSKAQQLVHTQEKGKLKSTNLELVEENTTLANKHDKITKDQKELEKKMKVDAIRMSKLRIGKERHVEYLKDRLEELRLKTGAETDETSSVALPYDFFGPRISSDDYTSEDKKKNSDSAPKNTSRTRNDNASHLSSSISTFVSKMLGPSLLGCIIAGSTMVAVIFNILYQGAVGDWVRRNASCKVLTGKFACCASLITILFGAAQN
eukprot:300601_1